MKSKAWITVLSLLVFGAGVFLFQFFRQKNRVMAHPKKGPIAEAIYGLGTITAHKSYTLKIGVASAVNKLYVYEGMHVNKNDPLLSFQESPGLLHKAPFAGVISKLNFKEQETVFPQAPILNLLDLKDRYISVSVEQAAAMRVKPGQNAFISFESIVNERFSGQVVSVYPQESQFLVHIASEDLPDAILPGMTADIAIEVGKKNDVLLIPFIALNKGKVMLLRRGKKITVDPKLGIIDGEWAEVVGGDIKVDDELMITGP